MILIKWNNRFISTKQITVLFTSICISLLIGCSSGSDVIKNKNMNLPGAEVYIATNDGLKYTGELLSVKDSVMILCEKYNASERDLADSVYAIFSLKNHDLKSIELKGKSKVVYGIIFGSVIGAGIGITGKKGDSFNMDKTLTGCCVGGLVGAMVGGIIGFFITNDEDVYEYANPEEYDFTQLNIYARYGSEEPEFLKKIK